MQFYHYILIGFAIAWSIILISLVWTIFKGAPYSPTRMNKVFKMLELAELQPNETVFDLGCGDGRILIIASKHFDAKAIGIEIAPFRYIYCKIIIFLMGLRKKVKIYFGNLFSLDISKADVVVCYLLQQTNDKLEEKLLCELQPNARVVSNRFTFSNLILLNEDRKQEIYVYKIN